MKKKIFALAFGLAAVIAFSACISNGKDAYYNKGLDMIQKMDKLAEGVYQAREDNEYYDSMFMACLMTFDKLDWFMRCADKWLSYHDGVVDDVLDIYKHFEVKV